MINLVQREVKKAVGFAQKNVQSDGRRKIE